MRRPYTLLYMCLLTLPLPAQTGNHNAEIARNLETFNDIYRQLDTYYVDSLSADTVIEWAINSMLSHVDPFTSYHPEDDEELRQMASGKYAGIGSVIRFSTRENRAVISEPYEGTPSQVAGLRAGDVLLTIDDTDVDGMPIEDVTQRLRGEAGTNVEVKVRRPGAEQPLTFTLTRKTIQLPVIPYYGIEGDPSEGIGYLLLTGFTEGAMIETRQALLDLKAQGMRRLVLDLRDNPGGALDEAVNIVNLFVPRGRKVVYTKGKIPSSNREYFTSSEPLDTLMPVVVLVDGGSASAAEILAGSLQDMDRAVVVGNRTYGKGLVQSIHDLPYRGNLKLTVSRYYIPSGRCIQAYDYRHLNADGSVGTVPDSLTREFHTMAGRSVRDGGGIKPDVVLDPDSLPTFIYDLFSGEELFNYATQYVVSHPTIAPAGEFSLSDEEYQQFVAYVQQSGFSANRRSEKVLQLLKDAAKAEGYLEEAQDEFDALEAKLNKDIAADLERLKDDVLPYLNTEIVSRYELQRGACKQQLRGDKGFEEAVRLLQNEDEYESILRP
ncbi:MAG: S41 family peptidase [Prevotellaceae bacterium]|nr:S41 family peptidase [Prevotellaceae bacterium]